MLRKFYLFEPNEDKKPLVAALGYFNTKTFEAACKSKRIRCAAISEEAAITLLQRTDGVGVGVYTRESALEAPEGLKRELACANRKTITDITGFLAVEPVIELTPIRELVLA